MKIKEKSQSFTNTCYMHFNERLGFVNPVEITDRSVTFTEYHNFMIL